MAKDLIHYEAKRSWWDGSSTTYCGIKIPKAKAAGWFEGVSCPTCKQLKKGK